VICRARFGLVTEIAWCSSQKGPSPRCPDVQAPLAQQYPFTACQRRHYWL